MCEAKPLSEEDMAQSLLLCEPVYGNQRGEVKDEMYAEKGRQARRDLLRWAATVAAQAAKIKELENGRDTAIGLLVRLFVDQGRDVVCIGCKRFAPRRAGIRHTKTCFVGKIEAALRGEEEGDGHDEGG